MHTHTNKNTHKKHKISLLKLSQIKDAKTKEWMIFHCNYVKFFDRLNNQILKESRSIVVSYIREEINYKKYQSFMYPIYQMLYPNGGISDNLDCSLRKTLKN